MGPGMTVAAPRGGHLARKRKARETETRRVIPRPSVVRGARFDPQLRAEKDAAMSMVAAASVPPTGPDTTSTGWWNDVTYDYNKKGSQGILQAAEDGQAAKARGVLLPFQQFRGLSNSSQLRGMFDRLSADHVELPVPEVELIALPLLPPLVYIAINDLKSREGAGHLRNTDHECPSGSDLRVRKDPLLAEFRDHGGDSIVYTPGAKPGLGTWGQVALVLFVFRSATGVY